MIDEPLGLAQLDEAKFYHQAARFASLFVNHPVIFGENIAECYERKISILSS